MKQTLGVCILLLAIAASGLAQAVAGMGGLSGVVRDATGASVPGAQVTVINDSKGIRRVMESNEAGVFAAPALVPAAGYAVRVTREGFAPFEAKNIEILVGQDLNVNVRLEVAATSATVEVTAATPLVEQTKTNVSQVVESAQIMDLPINGRRVDTFVLLTPAVVPDGTYGLISFRGIAGGNSFLTDGNDTTNQYYNENAGRTRISAQISQDAVQEFQVLSSAYSAEYGRASGGVINTVTRSGGNQTHGTAYWFFRNQAFNARDRYAPFRPNESRHQAGASLGGKFIENKLFYFFNTEFTRRDFPIVSSHTSAPLFDGSGNVIATCTKATPAQCDAAKAFLGRHKTTIPREANQELLFGKLDWRPTDMHSISASFNYLRWISPNGIQTAIALTNGSGLGGNGISTVRTRYGRLSWTGILKNNIVNEVRFGWFKDRLYDEFNQDLVPVTGYATISVAGVSNLGMANYLPRLNPSENRYQISDNLTWTTGRHTVKFGVDIVNTRDYANSLYNQWGTYSYSSFDAFAQDFTGNATGAKNWTTYSVGAGNPIVDTTIRDYNFYVQDQFRVTPALTLSYGLRYEYADLPQQEILNPDYSQTGRIPGTNKNFGPRVGIAYSFNNDRTVLRAGYGIYYSRVQGGLINTLFTKNGVYQQNISLSASRPDEKAAGPVFPNRLTVDLKAASGDITFAADDMRNPYTQHGSLGLEHQLTTNMGVTASYIWSRGLHLYGIRDANVGAMGPVVNYTIKDASGSTVGAYSTPTYLYANRVDKRYGRINVIESNGNTYYNALALQLRRRMSKGLQASVSYTWAHSIDYGQRGGDSNIFFSSGPTTLFNGDYRGEKGSGGLDQRHRFVFNSVWNPEFSKRTDFVGRFLINGWQLSQITTLASAQPDTAYVYISGTPFSGYAWNGSLNGLGGSNRVPFWPLSNIDVDQIYRTDARLSKILPISERFKAYVNFEAFNVFNHVSDTVIETRAFTATNGVLTPYPGYGTGKTSGGFPDGTNARRAQLSMRLVF